MKKSKRFIIGLVLLAVGIIGIFGLFDDFSSELLLGSIVIGAVGGLLLWLEKKAKTTEVAQPTANTQTAPTPKKEEIPDGEKDYNLLPNYANGMFLCYEYEQKICFIKEDNIEEKFGYVIGNGGKQLLFEFEPDNPYDIMAVAIYLDGNKLGYVYSGQTQEMIHDFHNKGWEVCAHLNKYSKEDMTASYKIGFYKPIDRFISKQFTLTKTTKKTYLGESRADNLYWCKEGDFAIVELDDIVDRNYVVLADGYKEVGELPQSASRFIDDYNPKKIYGIFNSCEEDENGKIKAKITVYLI